MRKVFEDALPHPRTLGKWYKNLNAEPGFTAEAFEVLKNKKSGTDKNIYCTLVVDEMAIRQQTVWNGRKTLGLVNCGTGGLDVDRVASQAFVMMLVCLDENWKLRVGYFLLTDSQLRLNLNQNVFNKMLGGRRKCSCVNV